MILKSKTETFAEKKHINIYKIKKYMKVILVEDDAVDTMYLKRLFAKVEKYEAEFFVNGQEAYHFLANKWDGKK